MTQEEKAKAYDDAIKEAAIAYKDEDKHLKATLERIFPKLKESEDERIRKAVIEYFRWNTKQILNEFSNKKALAWLEKQCEQKANDKVESKFHEGDWVVSPNGVYWHIDKISNNRYEVTSNTGESSNWNLDTNIYHKFTIQDAKDGDVLTVNNAVDNIIFIYERTLASHIVSYCKLINDVFESWEDARTCCEGNRYVHPATKEQREQLEKAMADAGFTFDFDKKELKKIKKISAWSEEDEKRLKSCLNVLQAKGIMGVTDTINTKWLKSLKDRVGCEVNCTTTKQWSEEDEYNFAFIQEALLGLDGDDSYREKCCKMAEWLESLRPQNTWKPSDEQIRELGIVATGKGWFSKEILSGLLEQLKRLREE